MKKPESGIIRIKDLPPEERDLVERSATILGFHENPRLFMRKLGTVPGFALRAELYRQINGLEFAEAEGGDAVTRGRARAARAYDLGLESITALRHFYPALPPMPESIRRDEGPKAALLRLIEWCDRAGLMAETVPLRRDSYEAEEAILRSLRMLSVVKPRASDPQPATPAAMSPQPRGRFTLRPIHQRLLRALLERNAISSEKCTAAKTISMQLSPKRAAKSLGPPLRELVAAKLVRSARGPEGGYWLSRKGKRTARAAGASE